MNVTQGGVSRQMVYNMDIRESPSHLSQLFQEVGLGGWGGWIQLKRQV